MRKREGARVAVFGAAAACVWLAACERGTQGTDVLVYGATPSGIAAAVAASRNGARVLLLNPDTHLGGMTAGGLGGTDIGSPNSVGGIADEFFRRVDAKYRRTDQFFLEPHVADAVFREMLAEQGILPVERSPIGSMVKAGDRILSVTTRDGRTHEARVFIDATYEGDLMAMSGARYTVGREANATYGETSNGVRAPYLPGGKRIDPWVVPGDPSSGLLPHVTAGPVAAVGSADGRVQAYNYRLCVTTDPGNRVPILPPAGYRPEEFELVARWTDQIVGHRTPRFADFVGMKPLPNGKFDVNTSAFVSTDLVGGSDAYPEATEEARAAIRRAHEDYLRSYLHFLATSPRLPAALREEASTYGLCADEFTANGNWPPQLYVREARRMIGAYVMTEHDVRGATRAGDSVGLASYPMDSHHTQRVAVDGSTVVEGALAIPAPSPYPISYRSLTPARGEVNNLLVPVCLSASHVAHGSIRMEPVFMILGHAAGTAAALAAPGSIAVQDVDYATLAARLRSEGQLLEWTGATGVTLSTDLPTPQPPGTPIVFRAEGQGSSGYRYRFYVRVPGGTDTMVQDYGVGSTWMMPASTPAGLYDVSVVVRTSVDAHYDARAETHFVLRPPPAAGVGLVGLPAGPQLAGTPIAFTAEGWGSRDYDYRFWTRAAGSTTPVMVQDYGFGPTWTMPASTPEGSYTVIVHVRTSPERLYDARAEVTQILRLPAPTSVTLAADRPSPQAEGAAVTFRAEAQGAPDVQYRFWARDAITGTPSIVQDYGSSPEWTTPATMPAGSYAVIVHARTSAAAAYDVRAELQYSFTAP